jgi:hypothetical protein
MAKFIAGLVVGVLLGGAVLYFGLFRGSSSARAPGTPIKPPDQGATAAGTAQIALSPELFNAALRSIFSEMRPPTFALGAAGEVEAGGCASQITILPQGSGVQTGVSFENDRLSAPLAFNGSYNSLVGCLQFSGSAQSALELRFDRESQTVYGQLTVESVILDGVNPVFTPLVTPIVQSSINTRVNPIKIIDGRQLTVSLPVSAAGGNLQAQVDDVRAEVKDGTLNLFVIYSFRGTAAEQPVS